MSRIEARDLLSVDLAAAVVCAAGCIAAQHVTELLAFASIEAWAAAATLAAGRWVGRIVRRGE